MSLLLFFLILLVSSYAAGLLGSLTGLGGGVIVIPVLTLGFGVDFHYAVGAALVASMATSSGSGAAYVKKGLTNVRLGMFLEIATTIGAVCGAAIAVYFNNAVIAIIYGLVLLLTAFMQMRRKKEIPYEKGQTYDIKHHAGGFSVMYVAGVLSGILGIGSGVLKVIAMDNIMKVPFKVSTTTSNFMMGVTACASAVVYIQRGNILPELACPVLVGVLFGALTGAKLLQKFDVSLLRKIFVVAILLVAANMIYMGLTGQF